MLPIAAEIATRLTRDQAHSARPHAPALPDADAGRRTSFAARVLGIAPHLSDGEDRPSARPRTSPRPA